MILVALRDYSVLQQPRFIGKFRVTSLFVANVIFLLKHGRICKILNQS